MSAIAEAEKIPDNEARAALRLLDDQGLLVAQEGGRSYSDGMGLALRYEEADRPLFWHRNLLRREILILAAKGYDAGEPDLAYREDTETFIDRPWAEAYATAKSLDY